MKTRYEEIEEAAVKFHRENPKVWECFVRFTFEVIHRGFRNYSAKGVFERIRWHTAVEMEGEQYKVNNNWAPYYGRKFNDNHPELGNGEFFILRQMR